MRARHQVGRIASSVRWGAAAVAVGFVCWLPPLIDQVFGDGNLAYILGFSGERERDALGWAPGFRAAGRALGWPPLLLRRDLDGGQVIDPYPGVGTTVGAVVGLVLLVATGPPSPPSRWSVAAAAGRRRAPRPMPPRPTPPRPG